MLTWTITMTSSQQKAPSSEDEFFDAESVGGYTTDGDGFHDALADGNDAETADTDSTAPGSPGSPGSLELAARAASATAVTSATGASAVGAEAEPPTFAAASAAAAGAEEGDAAAGGGGGAVPRRKRIPFKNQATISLWSVMKNCIGTCNES